jgi:hypothetical protein
MPYKEIQAELASAQKEGKKKCKQDVLLKCNLVAR